MIDKDVLRILNEERKREFVHVKRITGDDYRPGKPKEGFVVGYIEDGISLRKYFTNEDDARDFVENELNAKFKLDEFYESINEDWSAEDIDKYDKERITKVKQVLEKQFTRLGFTDVKWNEAKQIYFFKYLDEPYFIIIDTPGINASGYALYKANDYGVAKGRLLTDREVWLRPEDVTPFVRAVLSDIYKFILVNSFINEENNCDWKNFGKNGEILKCGDYVAKIVPQAVGNNYIATLNIKYKKQPLNMQTFEDKEEAKKWLENKLPKNESINEDHGDDYEDDYEDIPEEMHKERYVTYFETQEGRQKYTIYHVYTDSTDDSYNELCDKRDNQLGMYNSYKELKDVLKERAEKIAAKQGWTVKSIDNLGEDDEYYRERNKWESLNLDKITDKEAKEVAQYLNDFVTDKQNKYYYIDKAEAILNKYDDKK